MTYFNQVVVIRWALVSPQKKHVPSVTRKTQPFVLWRVAAVVGAIGDALEMVHAHVGPTNERTTTHGIHWTMFASVTTSLMAQPANNVRPTATAL